MSADASILETLARIEHKQDLILEIVARLAGVPKVSHLPKVGDPNKDCPLCTKPIRYDLDLNDGVINRKCGCSTGKIPLDLKVFAPQLPTKKKDEQDNDRADQEDRVDSTRGRGPNGR